MQGVPTLEALAQLPIPIPFSPSRGSSGKAIPGFASRPEFSSKRGGKAHRIRNASDRAWRRALPVPHRPTEISFWISKVIHL